MLINNENIPNFFSKIEFFLYYNNYLLKIKYYNNYLLNN